MGYRKLNESSSVTNKKFYEMLYAESEVHEAAADVKYF